MAEQPYRYKAFISYRHLENDRRWAKWLVHGLETFRTPKGLVQLGFPSRIGKLFRDDDENAASSDLAEQIERPLRDSQYLIVVCSRATPASKWVAREIEFFRSLGRGRQILTLLTEGEPFEAFPGNLLRAPRTRTDPSGIEVVEWENVEPIAADVRDKAGEGRREVERRALLQIAAGLLGCGFDDLFQRERQRAKRRQRFLGSVATVAGVLIVSGGYGWWDYSVPKTAYFADVGSRWGVPFGIGPLARDIAAHRASNYRITSQYHKVTDIRHVNSFGTLAALSGDSFDSESFYSGVAEWKIFYQDNRVKTIVLYGPQGQIIRKIDYEFAPNGQTALEQYRTEKGTVSALDTEMSSMLIFPHGPTIQPKSQVAVHFLTFDSDGYVVLRNYQTAFGRPADGGNGSFGRVYSYYPTGQIRVIKDIDQTGAVHVDAAGIAQISRQYSALGDYTAIAWEDSQGHGWRNSHGYARWIAHRDAFGNILRVDFLAPDGRPAIATNLGVAYVAYAYDNGNPIDEKYRDLAGRPARHRAGFAELRWKYDQKGRPVEDRYYDLSGHPMLNGSGYFKLAREYDDRGNITDQRLYGLNGRLVGTEMYDEHANIAELRYSGRSEGAPHFGASQFAEIKRHYDDHGNIDRQTYFSALGKPVLNGLGFVSVSRSYDSARDMEIERYFGLHGEAVIRKDLGVARIVRQYDQYGNLVLERYLDRSGKPSPRADLGFAEIDAKYDDKGHAIEEHYFGINGQLQPRSDFGVSSIVRSYSPDGARWSEAYFDTANKPTVRTDLGISSFTVHLDNFGNEVETDYFDRGGRLSPRRDYGTAVILRRYDGRAQTEESYLDADRKAVVRKDRGFARMKFGYDDRGYREKEQYFDPSGHPVNNLLGFSEVERRFNDLGKKLEEWYVDESGSPAIRADLGAAKIVWKYDKNANLKEELFLGADGRLALSKLGFAREILTYDAGATLVEKARFDPAGKRIVTN